MAETRAPDKTPATASPQAPSITTPRVAVLTEGASYTAQVGLLVHHEPVRPPTGERPRRHETPRPPGVCAVPSRKAAPAPARETADVVDVPW